MQQAVAYNDIDLLSKVAPNTYVEGDLVFKIPEGEKPTKLYITYWPSLFEPKIVIEIKLA